MGHALEQTEWSAWVTEGDPRVQRAREEVDHWQGRFQEAEAQALAGHGAVQVELQRASDVHRVHVAQQRGMAARDMLGIFQAAHGLHEEMGEDGETVTRAKSLPKGPAKQALEAMEAHVARLDEHAREEEGRTQNGKLLNSQ